MNIKKKIFIQYLRKFKQLPFEKYIKPFQYRPKKKVTAAYKHYFANGFLSKNQTLQTLINDGHVKATGEGAFAETVEDYQKYLVQNWPVRRRFEAEYLLGLDFKVKYRYPFADIRLLQYCINLPFSERVNRKKNRLFFKNVCDRLLPKGYTDLDKRKGSVKPAAALGGLKIDKSIFSLYDNLSKAGFVDFLDSEEMRQFSTNKKPFYYTLFDYLVLGELNKTYDLNL